MLPIGAIRSGHLEGVLSPYWPLKGLGNPENGASRETTITRAEEGLPFGRRSGLTRSVLVRTIGPHLPPGASLSHPSPSASPGTDTRSVPEGDLSVPVSAGFTPGNWIHRPATAQATKRPLFDLAVGYRGAPFRPKTRQGEV